MVELDSVIDADILGGGIYEFVATVVVEVFSVAGISLMSHNRNCIAWTMRSSGVTVG